MGRNRRLLPGLLLLALALLAGGAEADVDSAEALLADDRVTAAVKTLEHHLERHPEDRDAWVRLAHIQRRRCALASARAIYERLLARDLSDPGARAGLAEIDLLLGDPQGALEHAALALGTEAGRRLGGAWRARAMALIDLGRYQAARAAAEHGVRVAPSDPLVLESLARAAFRGGDMAAARDAYTRVLALDPENEEANVRLGSGFGPGQHDRPWERDADASLFADAVAAWDRSDLGAADAAFRTLCDRAPTCFKYRLGLGLVRRSLRRFHELRFGGDIAVAYNKLPAPEIPGLDEYVRDLDALPTWSRHVIRASIGPATQWIQGLVDAGASHEILRIADTLDDAPSRRGLRDTLTFDGRWYAHVRGVGGRTAATGIEQLRSAAHLGFNTFAHEFAHQVLRFAMPPELLAEVRRLYRDARFAGRCLDYYAASNVDEYFAQGYEALVSHAKRGCLRDTARHTRAELAERDPALHAFLLKHMDFSFEDEGRALHPFRAALPP